MTRSPSEYPSQWPSKHPPGPTHSIPPSEPRKRAIVAGICAMLLGAFIVSAFVRACRGDDFWNQRRAPAQQPGEP
ncbi:MAG TPA: hypothetical protein VJR89_31105 [Polyangiales bacterium]|nr:hypothetical protein [Polyangiales bacterium]